MIEKLYYHVEKDVLCVSTEDKLWYDANKYWKIVSYRGVKPRTIKDEVEISELLNESGFEYIGEL